MFGSVHATDIAVGAPRVLPGSLAAGKALPGDVQALAKGEWADAMAAATAAAEHARLAQEASNAAERFARAGTSQQVGAAQTGCMVFVKQFRQAACC